MENLLLSVSLIDAEPYLLAFAAGVMAQRLYTMYAWRFAATTKQAIVKSK